MIIKIEVSQILRETIYIWFPSLKLLDRDAVPGDNVLYHMSHFHSIFKY